ncbi:MAG: hypothetical protein IJC24_03180 [Clostridia bacterium]|nr:hypothetical protein [Clostridia bacterium]
MKKRVSLTMMGMIVILAMMMAVGCANNTPDPAPSPSPMATAKPSPDAPMVEVSPSAEQSPMQEGPIENFVEGAVIELTQLPAEISEAIKKEYADATVKSASYATYENQQMYKIAIQRAEDDATEDVYVTSEGKIIPAKATAASPSPDGGGAGAAGSTDAPAGGVESGK